MAKVTIYSTPTCSFCTLAKDYFNANNVEYTEIDVAADPAKAEEMVKKSGQMGVPVIIVAKEDGTEEIIVGFEKDKLASLLDIA